MQGEQNGSRTAPSDGEMEVQPGETADQDQSNENVNGDNNVDPSEEDMEFTMMEPVTIEINVDGAVVLHIKLTVNKSLYQVPVITPLPMSDSRGLTVLVYNLLIINLIVFPYHVDNNVDPSEEDMEFTMMEPVTIEMNVNGAVVLHIKLTVNKSLYQVPVVLSRPAQPSSSKPRSNKGKRKRRNVKVTQEHRHGNKTVSLFQSPEEEAARFSRALQEINRRIMGQFMTWLS
ncbi:hypothetical protein OS493_034560 [Desmophyllum pertusum]|uniref:Uncharacterized protein n=1 Tax=Desmophyllum pertusum TaxID=174260 RepID=A0A9W9Y861_9CNID|nr:hypothetical protein OS493_034560 [Desmophyllum pertusum]